MSATKTKVIGLGAIVAALMLIGSVTLVVTPSATNAFALSHAQKVFKGDIKQFIKCLKDNEASKTRFKDCLQKVFGITLAAKQKAKLK